jgi:hypothetical protein
MAYMNSRRRASDELRKISDAIDESILGASAEELREELVAQGLDPAKVVAEMDAIAEKAKTAGAKARLERAKDAVKSFNSERPQTQTIDRATLRSDLRQMRSGRANNDDRMMMAARKGKKLSESDEEGTLDDLALLKALEAKDSEAADE